jgi:hypothetical protein
VRQAKLTLKNEEWDMRKETQKIARAFRDGLPAKAARTETDGTNVWLHGNRIAWRVDDRLCLSLAGWPTATTRARLNGILETFGLQGKFYQCDHEQWFDGKAAINSEGRNCTVSMQLDATDWVEFYI